MPVNNRNQSRRRMPMNLEGRYGKIGISAVQAAARYSSGRKRTHRSACRGTVRVGRSFCDRSASLRHAGPGSARLDVACKQLVRWTDIGNDQMRSKSQAAWETAARCATLAQESDDPQEREHYVRLRDP